MEKNYLFIYDTQDNYDLSAFDFTDIHIWNIAPVHNKKKEQQLFFYAKNISEINNIIDNQYIPHITFLGDNIFSNFYHDTLLPECENLERFWFPEKKHLNQEYINLFLNLPKIDTTSIAVVFNPMFQKDISYQEFYFFLQLLYSQYKSPLFYKDLEMYDNEFFSKNNKAIINGTIHYIVLGLFGDYYISNEPTYQTINYGILKDSQCVICDFANTCKQRGLGIIKHEEKLKSCIGIKVYQQN